MSTPVREPQPGERWLHRAFGEVEVVEAATYQPDGEAWLVVRAVADPSIRRAVDPASLIGRAE